MNLLPHVTQAVVFVFYGSLFWTMFCATAAYRIAFVGAIGFTKWKRRTKRWGIVMAASGALSVVLVIVTWLLELFHVIA